MREARFYTFSDVYLAVERMAKKFMEQKIKFDSIVCVGRGGMFPARLFSDMLGVKSIQYVDIHYSTNDAQGDVEYDDIRISGGRALIVDDIYDTGRTFDVISGYMRKDDIFYTIVTKNIVSNFVEQGVLVSSLYLPTEIWAVFPWEAYEYQRQIS